MPNERRARRMQVLHLGTGHRTHWIWGVGEHLVKLLVFVTVLIAFLESLYLIRAIQAEGLRMSRELAPMDSRPYTGPAAPVEKPFPQLPPPSSGSHGREATEADREAFAEASYLEGEAGAPTLARVQARVRDFYKSQGVVDEEFLWLTSLDEADRAYQGALVAALANYHAGDAAHAVLSLETALKELDARHLIGRLRLLQSLELMAREAGDGEKARQAGEAALATGETIAAVTRRALAATPAGRELAAAPLDEAFARYRRESRAHRELLDVLSKDGKLKDALANLFKLAERK